MAKTKNDAAQIWGDDEFQFQGQRSDESVMLMRRQHGTVLVRSLLGAVISLVIPYFLIRVFDGSVLGWVLVIYFALLALFVGHRVYGFFNSVMLLTNQRLLDVTQKGFFARTINEAELSRIQDVSSEVKGVLQTTFHYGQVIIRTASKDSALIIENIADPYEVQQAIVRALKDVQ